MTASNADLTNETGVEVTWKIRFRGEDCYTGQLYVPQTAQTDWTRNEVIAALQEHHLPLIRAVISEFATVESVRVRSRGTIDAGQETLQTIEQAGLVEGFAAPKWLTWKFREYPDNVNRLNVSGVNTPFKYGRMQFAGVCADMIDGESARAALSDDLIALALALPTIPTITTGTPDNPIFGLVMVRHVGTGAPTHEGGPPTAPYVLRQKANILDMQFVGIGHQTNRDN